MGLVIARKYWVKRSRELGIRLLSQVNSVIHLTQKQKRLKD